MKYLEEELKKEIIKSEQSLYDRILGMILLKNEVLEDFILAGLTPHDFPERRQQIVFGTMMWLSMANKPIDLVTMAESLRSHNAFEEVGTKYLISLLERFKI